MYCIQCGAKNPDDSNFCRKCGMDVRTLRSAAMDAPPDVPSEVDDEEVGMMLERAYQYYDAGSLDLAFDAVRSALRANPESVAGRSLLSSIYERRGNLEAAIRQMERVVDSNPESSADINRLEALRLRARIEREEMEPVGSNSVWVQSLSRSKVVAGAAVALLLVAAVMVFATRGGRPVDQEDTTVAATPPASQAPAATQPAVRPSGIVNSSLFPEGTTTTEGRVSSPPADNRSNVPAVPQPPIPRPSAAQPAPAQPVQSSPPPVAQPAQPQPSITIRPSQPDASPAPSPGTAAPARQMTGLDYQRAAMDYKARGDRENAIANFRRAIEAFRREAADDGQAAQKGIRSCELELRLLGVE